MSSPTLTDLFDPARNSLNFLRFVFAAGVIVSHAWLITGAGDPPLFGGSSPGAWSVACFFVISGFLVTRSRMRHPVGVYAWDRFLRIVPAFVVVLLVTAFVFAPLSVMLGPGHYDFGSAVGYVFRNLFTFYAPILNQPTIDGTLAISFQDNLWGQIWNGSLWSLFFEVLCYIGISIAVSLFRGRWLGRALLAVAALLTVLVYLVLASQPSWNVVLVAPLPLAFVVGACLWVYRDAIRINRFTVGGSFALLLAGGFTDVALSFVPFAVGILVFWLADRLPLAWFGRVHDASYGLYIYGYPVQVLAVLVVMNLGWDVPLVINTLVVLAITAVLAYASSALVERPALELRARSPWFRDARRSLSRPVRAAVVAGTVLVVGGGAAFAAGTGNLPDPLQRVVANVVSAVGLPDVVPHPDDHELDAVVVDTDPDTPGVQPELLPTPVGTPFAPTVPDRPVPTPTVPGRGVPEAPSVPTVPVVPGPDLPDVPGLPDVPEVPDLPVVPDIGGAVGDVTDPTSRVAPGALPPVLPLP